MTIDYVTWLSRMTNSIVDASTIARDKPGAYKEPTWLQKRMYIADLLVPVVKTEDQVDDWITVFCVRLGESETFYSSQPVSYLTTYPTSDILGPDEAHAYHHTEGASESVAWFKEFKKKVEGGWTFGW